MLEFCRTVDPNLQDYEADGVCFHPWLDINEYTKAERI